jgi:hypothetical protein
MVGTSEHFIQCDNFSVVKTPDDGRLRPKHASGGEEKVKIALMTE